MAAGAAVCAYIIRLGEPERGGDMLRMLAAVVGYARLGLYAAEYGSNERGRWGEPDRMVADEVGATGREYIGAYGDT